ncbi:hypothetical protein A9Q81_27810 [Gammaproteobacteria bacterium 42_54_T18]|nr:hypothetical protein A9Q81_27810 [Gammaproteobacteria bacterium 42_54_T18]
MTVHYAEAPVGRVSLSVNKTLVQGISRYLLNENVALDVTRKRFERINALSRSPNGVMISQTEYGGVPVEVVDPEHQSHARTVLYCHGGGFCIGSPKIHRELTAWLAKTLGARIVVPGYRLAPEHPYPSAPDDILSVYRGLVASGVSSKNIVMIGDSAGGNLVMVTLQRLKALREMLPAGAVLYSPWVDLRCMTESYVTKQAADPMLSGSWLRSMREHYCHGEGFNNSDISPVLGDLSAMPPILIHVGSEEVLLNDSLLLARHLKEQGGEVQLKVWEKLWHVFQAQIEIFEPARQSVHETRDFLASVF